MNAMDLAQVPKNSVENLLKTKHREMFSCLLYIVTNIQTQCDQNLSHNLIGCLCLTCIAVSSDLLMPL